MKRINRIFLVISIFCIASIFLLITPSYSRFVYSGTLSGSAVVPSKMVNITYKYYYIDELNNKVEFKEPVTINYIRGAPITLSDTLVSDIDYSEVKYYINNTLYTDSTYIANNNVIVEEDYYLNIYTITYHLNDGVLTDTPVTEYTSVTETFSLPTPTKIGNNFLGWSRVMQLEEFSTIQEASKLENNTVYDTGSQRNRHIYIRVTSGVGYAVFTNYSGQDRLVVYTDDNNSIIQYSTNQTNWTRINNWLTSGELYYQYFTLDENGRNEDCGIKVYDGTFEEYVQELSSIDTETDAINPYTITKGSTGNIDVYAIWQTKTSYTVTFRANNGTGTMPNQTFYAGESQKLSKNLFTRNNYRFIGWATSTINAMRGNVTYTDEQEITLTANRTLYAVWQR